MDLHLIGGQLLPLKDQQMTTQFFFFEKMSDNLASNLVQRSLETMDISSMGNIRSDTLLCKEAPTFSLKSRKLTPSLTARTK